METTLDRVVASDVVPGLPVREFRVYKGRRHYSGWYWSATMGRLLVYESRLELARILLADFDHTVVGIAPQPFQLTGRDGSRTQRHVPDVLLVHTDGAVTVVDVKAASRMGDEKVVAQFAWTRELCRERGWRFEAWSGESGPRLENIRFLAGYRRPKMVDLALIPRLLEAAHDQSTLGGLEQSMAEPVMAVRPVVLHMLWSGLLEADLNAWLGVDTRIWLPAWGMA
ncbi:TnsA-like heteromeric transposase endonuclease subunit [Streptacidiphilus sp. N1-10]|uniref:TnsA-like heteromeric transposase endonuclease subunit n=1 Tax=Streptacidiphilus jeojiensis TaxID=3229225 RepID=A0ABV6XX10_9ACTN